MMRVSRTNKVRVTGADFLHQLLKVRIHRISVGLWCHTRRLGFGGNFVAVFVGTNLEPNLATVLSLVPGPNIGNKIVKGVTDVRRTIDIRNGSCDV